MVKNKKGLSPVVATISLILLTVSAVAIIAGLIIPMIRDNLYESTECLDYQNYFILDDEFGYNCYGPENTISGIAKGYLITIRAGGADEEEAEEVVGFKLSFIKEGSSETVDIMDKMPASDEIKMVQDTDAQIRLPQPGEVITYWYSRAGHDFDKVTVHPILKSGKVCELSDSIELWGCE